MTRLTKIDGIGQNECIGCSRCGPNACSGRTDAWARNETMVDWIARQGPKIYAAWQELVRCENRAD